MSASVLSGDDANNAVMMYVTKILKNTTGEDNKKTEMYACPFQVHIQIDTN